jgi:hypothetical protein
MLYEAGKRLMHEHGRYEAALEVFEQCIEFRKATGLDAEAFRNLERYRAECKAHMALQAVGLMDAGDAAVASMNELLHAARIYEPHASKYANAMVHKGYDDADFLLTLNRFEISQLQQECGIAVGHARKLDRFISENPSPSLPWHVRVWRGCFDTASRVGDLQRAAGIIKGASKQ